MNIARWIDLPRFDDARGSLVAIEGGRSIPFEIRRVYYILADGKGTERGFHAHKTLQQVAVCVSGRCRMRLDDGNCREDCVLDNPGRGLFIGAMIWHEMRDFSTDCVLLMLADAPYDEADYVFRYDEFLKYTLSRPPHKTS